MPINPMYFQILSPQQASPMLYGMNQGSQIMGQNIQNQLQSAQLPYAGQMAQANLANTQAQAPYTQSMTALNNAELPYAQYKFLGPMMGVMAQQARVAVQNANSYREMVQANPDLMKNPQFVAAYNTAMNNSASLINSGYGFNGLPGMPSLPGTPNSSTQNNSPAYFQSSSPASQPAQQNNAVNNGGAGAPAPTAPTSGMPTTIPMRTLPQTPQQIQQLQKFFPDAQPQQTAQQDSQQQTSQQQYWQNQAALKSYTTDQAKRLAAGNRFSITSQQLISDFDAGASTYFSPQGQAQLKADEATAAATGKISPSLQAYRKFQQDVTQANLQGAMLEGVPSDQIARGEYSEMFEPAKWTNNPGGARVQMVNAINLGLKADAANKMTVGKTVQQPDQLYSATAPQNTGAGLGSSLQNARIRVVSPDGKSGTIPAAQLQAALNSGFRRR